MARHDHNFLVIALLDCDVVMWPEGDSDILNFHFSQGDVAFLTLADARVGMRNDRTTDYRNVTVEFLDPKVTNYGYQAYLGTWDYGPSEISSAGRSPRQVHELAPAGSGHSERRTTAFARSVSTARETRPGIAESR